jgi:hypothetical protein
MIDLRLQFLTRETLANLKKKSSLTYLAIYGKNILLITHSLEGERSDRFLSMLFSTLIL